MKAYLETDPKYSGELKQIWLWNEFPFRSSFGGGQDIGIDLVALTNEGGYWAVQCKCYQKGTHISKEEVDSFLAASGKTFQNEESKSVKFSQRLWISTTNNWSANAEEALTGQDPPVSRVNLRDLESAPVDWDKLKKGLSGDKAAVPKNKLLPHQKEAVDSARKYFETYDRGKLIMACGTGKTFTSLKIAETLTKNRGLILFLVPSISLLGQILNEWTAQAECRIKSICVCSDPKVSGVNRNISEKDLINGSTLDLPLPAATDPESIAKQLESSRSHGGLVVVFSTYQSIGVVSEAQKKVSKKLSEDLIFDLIICDEAHRTTGVAFSGEENSSFVRVHENNFIKARKRLYMTATPRLYNEESKQKAARNAAVLCSMDDEALYGREIYRLGFGKAVEKNLLSDYKVLVLTLSETDIPKAFQELIASRGEINTDDKVKLVGCINALSKRIVDGKGLILKDDAAPMRSTVAFCQNIKNSKRIVEVFNIGGETWRQSLDPKDCRNFISVEARHIDGTMNAPARDEKLCWLRKSSSEGEGCRILANVRCLSEGVDVPSLDAVLFLSAKNSQIDVVQSVGRVMRKSEGKKFGYIIIPVFISPGAEPEKILDGSSYKVIWSVLNALRSHDDRFNAIVNKMELNKNKPPQILVGRPENLNEEETAYGSSAENETLQSQLQLKFKELQNIIYAKIVEKVGDRRYWKEWAEDIADVAQKHIARISGLISEDGVRRDEFEKFLNGLRKIINENVTKEAAVEMLAQHLITEPVFDALFEKYSFVKSNPVSASMRKMLDVLEKHAFDEDLEKFKEFYESVKMRAQGIDNTEGRQRVIIELYDSFFKTAFPKMAKKLGIVYTPVECVDFIIKSVAYLLEKEFGRSISDGNVHILDPFTGTGSFIVRLLQNGLIKSKDLARKYKSELHANEIVLLAYYIASVNIENAYCDVSQDKKFVPFEGICLTDTFQLGEKDEKEMFAEMFSETSKRVKKQKETPIMVILGNPPYSVGQKSANDNAKNERYPRLEERIEKTYVSQSEAVNKNSIYDSYYKAFRWSSDRLDPANGGIIAFISNAGWLDGVSSSGFRRCLEQEFSSVYVFNLRGSIRGKIGDAAKREGQNVFDIMQGVAVTFLIKNPDKTKAAQEKHSKAEIYYCDIGDYLSRSKKFEILKSAGIWNINWRRIKPDKHGDWLNQKNDKFSDFIPLYPKNKFDKDSQSFFVIYSNGIGSSRDAWLYNFSKDSLLRNVKRHIDFYNKQVDGYKNALNENPDLDADAFKDNSPDKIAWSSSLVDNLRRLKKASFDETKIAVAAYRPFCRHYLYYGDKMIHRPGQIETFIGSEKFNFSNAESFIICVSNGNILISKNIVVAHFNGDSHCFPLYYYEEQRNFLNPSGGEYVRRDGISDFILKQAKEKYGGKVSKKDIFCYVYGFLHAPRYRSVFSADLKKSLPRIPLIELPEDFWAFSKAGKELAELHLNYENRPKLKEVKVTGEKAGNFEVKKMCFADRNKKDVIIYNDYIKISGIPKEVYGYVINGRSAVEWIMERYRVTVTNGSGIKNDPNNWTKEHNNPRYILDLLLSVMTLSLETQKIINTLPNPKF
jgi:predicted helicase